MVLVAVARQAFGKKMYICLHIIHFFICDLLVSLAASLFQVQLCELMILTLCSCDRIDMGVGIGFHLGAVSFKMKLLYPHSLL